MASQLGSVTVGAVPEEQSGQVGGMQNTGGQLGAAIGTALAGAILISALSASFLPASRTTQPSRPVSCQRLRASCRAGCRSFPTSSSKPRSTTQTCAQRPPTRSSRRTRPPGSRVCAPPWPSSRSSASSRCSSPAASHRPTRHRSEAERAAATGTRDLLNAYGSALSKPAVGAIQTGRARAERRAGSGGGRPGTRRWTTSPRS